MTWLAPSVIATLFGTLILGMVYGFLYTQDRQKYLAVWTGAWFLSAARFVLMLVILHLPPQPWFWPLHQLCTLGSGVMLLWGAQIFLERPLPAWWLAAAGGAAIWVVVHPFTGLGFLALTIPTYLFLAVVFIYTGLAFFRSTRLEGLGRSVTGVSFILWGLHKADYPLIRPLTWLAPWGYLLAAALEMLTALGLLLAYFQKTRARLLAAQGEIQAGRDRLEALVEHAGEGIFQSDAAGRLLAANPALAALWGVADPQALLGRPFFLAPEIFTEPAERAVLQDLLKQEGQVRAFLCRVTTAPGRRAQWSLNVRAVRDAQGQLEFWEGTINDLTHRLLAEEALRRSLDQSQEARQEVESLLISTRATLEKQDFNELARTILQECQSLLGAEAGYLALLDRTGRENRVLLLNPGRRPGSAAALPLAYPASPSQASLGQDPVFHNDFPASPWSGLPPPELTDLANALFAPLIIEGRVVGVLGLGDKPGGFRELDARRAGAFAELAAVGLHKSLTRQALAASEERFRLMFATIPDAVTLSTLEGIMVDVNQSFCRLTGYTREELVGRTAQALNLLTDGVEREEVLNRLRQAGHTVNQELAIRGRDGQVKTALVSGAVLELDGQPHILAIARDVTQLKEDERERALLAEQLRQSQKMEAVGTLAGGIAHDFNNILGAILGYAELAQARVEEGDQPDREIANIVSSALRAKDLVKQLLTFSRKLESDLRPVDANLCLAAAARMLERTIPRMIALELDLAPDLALVNADPIQLEQVLMNLGTNAKDAMPEGGTLRVETLNLPLAPGERPELSAGEPGDYVAIRVSDTGHGMDKETLQHIFDPFFTTKDVGRGTGLGLSSVFGIVESHGGAITCQSEPGRGTWFEILLPALPRTELSQESPAPLATVPRGQGERVLVVDDEDTLRELAQRFLERGGYQAGEARSGEEALAVFRREPAELVLLDLFMPGMGGLKCCQELLELYPGVKILIASGYAAQGMVAEALALGAWGFLAKPYHQDDLLNAVAAALAGRPAEAPSPLPA
ncbi:MAG: PAS domain S-box protein [Deltaproteobacteria bacterium]|nr:PAS domain S-box protein [Deltaproteobacteria bacterium]